MLNEVLKKIRKNTKNIANKSNIELKLCNKKLYSYATENKYEIVVTTRECYQRLFPGCSIF